MPASKTHHIRLTSKAARFSDIASYAVTAGPIIDSLRNAPSAAAESATQLIDCLFQKRQKRFQFYDAARRIDYWVWVASDGINLIQIEGVPYETSQVMRAIFAWEQRDEDEPWYTEESFPLTQAIAHFLEALYGVYQHV